MESQKNKVAIISGVTGLVGGYLLNQLLKDPDYKKVIAIVRRPLETDHEKLVQKVVDFSQLPGAIEGLEADHGYCCLGTTIKTAGSKEKQYAVDHDYVVAFASGCHAAGVKFFSVVSSIGANAESSNFYLRTKGEMERDLAQIPFEGLFILQPSMLLGERNEFRAGEKAGIALMKLLGPLMVGGLRKYRGVQAESVARMMIRAVGSARRGLVIIKSDQIG